MSTPAVSGPIAIMQKEITFSVPTSATSAHGEPLLKVKSQVATIGIGPPANRLAPVKARAEAE
ncbi:hypothetical protein D3C80_2221120 [compost metagenome]